SVVGGTPTTERPTRPCTGLTPIYTLIQLNCKKLFYFALCKVLVYEYLYFKLKQGKDMVAQVICVRGMEHADRQCVAQRSTEAKA
ncbi:MAG: hypothetical protein NZ519_03180, partial [Bacteroidia bacterium]|nr:hypothetical protein [Bacteroidia bacterium]